MADWVDAKYSITGLAEAKDGAYYEIVSLYEVHFDLGPIRNMFVVSHGDVDGDNPWDHVFSDLRSAVADFGKEAKRKYKYKDGHEEPVYEKIEWTDEWKYYVEDLIPEYRWSKEEKEYGPSNPWDAPGMKVSDFLPGVY